MIRSFADAETERFYTTGQSRRIPTDILRRAAMRLTQLNAAYRAKFHFPYMIFVRGHTKEGIFFYFDRRLNNDPEIELKNALDQVYGITRFRLRRKFGEV